MNIEGTIKVEILSLFKHGTDVYYPGEVAIVAYHIGEYWCRAGWAKDLGGILDTGRPVAGETILLVESVVQIEDIQSVGE